MIYKTLELFSGTGSFSKVAKKLGHKTFMIDNDASLNPDLVADIIDLREDQLPYKPDIMWASPPCETFSVASISHHWTGGKKAYIPKTDKAVLGIEKVESTLDLIDQLKPKYWFIENPRGVLRNLPVMQGLHRVTVTYCQYGDTRMKPTDIWTNLLKWKPRPMCKNGDKCHIKAPRGSKTGTQGLKNAKLRGVIPPKLFEEIFEAVIKEEL
jgi:site-specific DNA-cytosine methylase